MLLRHHSCLPAPLRCGPQPSPSQLQSTSVSFENCSTGLARLVVAEAAIREGSGGRSVGEHSAVGGLQWTGPAVADAVATRAEHCAAQAARPSAGATPSTPCLVPAIPSDVLSGPHTGQQMGDVETVPIYSSLIRLRRIAQTEDLWARTQACCRRAARERAGHGCPQGTSCFNALLSLCKQTRSA